MKIFKTLILLLIPLGIFSQDTIFYSPSECISTYNAFLNNSDYSQVLALAHEILPEGTVIMDPEKLSNGVDVEDILDEMGIDQGTSFNFEFQRENPLDEKMYFNRYEQFYYGIKVEGGGYVEGKAVYDGPSSGPCDELVMLIPHIITGINLTTTPTYTASNVVGDFPNLTTNDLELLIVSNAEGNCNNNLVWKGIYNQSGQSFLRYVDAHTGQISRTIEIGHHLVAPMNNTASYGNTVDLDDRTTNGVTDLASPDGTLRVYNFGSILPATDPINSSEWSTSLIPTTTNGSWTTEAPTEVYQLFYLMSYARGVYKSLDLDITQIEAGVSLGFNNSRSAVENNSSLAFFLFGYNNGQPLIEIDIVGHEFAHAILDNFIVDENIMHEGLSDIFGTFIESKFQNGSTDWIYGDNNSNFLPSFDYRDASDDACFKFINATRLEYLNGNVLNHWFQLISEGDPNVFVPSLGMDAALNIVLAALTTGGDNPSFEDFARQTLSNTMLNFGRCSDEYKAIYNAWEEVFCDPSQPLNLSGFPQPCTFSISGPLQTCEEENHVSNPSPYIFCYDGPNSKYQWTIVSENSTQFGLSGNQTGNMTITDGPCLTIDEIPEFNYYPKYFTIEVYNLTLGPDSKIKKTIPIFDCNEDDPTCQDYYGLMPNNTSNLKEIDNSLKKNVDLIKVYSTEGKELFSTKNIDNFLLTEIKYKGFLLISYLDKNGKVITTRKFFNQ